MTDDEDYLYEAFEYDIVEGTDGEEYFPYKVAVSDSFFDEGPRLANPGYVAGVKGRFSEQVRLDKVAEYYGFDIERALEIIGEYVNLEEFKDCEEGTELIAYILMRRRDGEVVAVRFVEDRYFPFQRGSETYLEMIERIDAARIISDND